MVTLTLSTHSEGGVTDSDIKLARQIEEVLSRGNS
jgi:pterin-4a-carbinolamine dehydratase